MIPLILALTAPLAGALLVVILPWRMRLWGVLIGLIATLAGLAGAQTIEHAPAWCSPLFIVADSLLLLYFFWQGFKAGSKPVWLLALLQTFLFVPLIFSGAGAHESALMMDGLALFMALLVTIVGGVIILYATHYIDAEAWDTRRKKAFIAILMAFVAVMNWLVSVQNLEWFFLFFELTTLASFLLIGSRGDEESRANALRALWMNQVGGVAILTALWLLEAMKLPFTWYAVLENGSTMAGVLLFLSIAALVKGAQIPFQGWLLGAMVAPTPVSAILHSATMVKIAPWLILKIAPALAGTLLSSLLALLGSFVFFAAGWLALSEEPFKKILAWSTIALLGLMIAMAAMATPLTMTIALVLMLFHALAKALLFLEAGIIERLWHIKTLPAMKELYAQAPRTSLLIVMGFLFLTLPPFGAFLAKWAAIIAAAQEGWRLAIGLPILILIVFGSTLLVILYFRTTGVLYKRPGSQYGLTKETIPPLYNLPTMTLSWMTLVATLFLLPLWRLLGTIAEAPSELLAFVDLPFWVVAAALIMIALLVPLTIRAHLQGVDRAREYSCGERISVNEASYNLAPCQRSARLLMWFAALLWGAILVAGVSA
ncbi:MAG: pesticidal protein Cry5Ba [Campylobacterales bacterium]